MPEEQGGGGKDPQPGQEELEHYGDHENVGADFEDPPRGSSCCHVSETLNGRGEPVEVVDIAEPLQDRQTPLRLGRVMR